MALRFARWSVPLTLWTWGGIFVYFYGSGRLQSFLHPDFRPLVLGTGLGLMATGLLLAIFDRPALPEATAANPTADPSLCLDGCGRAHPVPTARGLLKGFVLCFPLIGAALVSPDGFGAAFVRNRDVSKSVNIPSTAVIAPSPVSQTTTAASDNKSQYLKTDAAGRVKAELVDFRYAAQSPELRKDFDHKVLEVIGQFLPTPGADHQHFTLTRLFLICCAADAQPINVLVEIKPSASVPSTLPEMGWIQVAGTVRFEHTDQIVATPVIMAEEIRSIPVPKEKYLY